jgi:hypothetical protein
MFAPVWIGTQACECGEGPDENPVSSGTPFT